MQQGNPPPKWIARLLIALVMLSLGAAWAGDLLLAAVVKDNPLVLIALNPRNRNLAFASPDLAALPYYTVGFLRLVASDPLYFLLGFWWGDRALAWVERRSRSYGPFVRDAEGWFKRFAYPLIFAFPNNIICLLSGAANIKVRTFMILNISGTIVRLIVVRQFAELFDSEITSIVDWISRYRTPILILSAVLVAWTIFGEFRGDNSQLKTLIDLEKSPDSDETSSDEPSASDEAESPAAPPEET